MQGVEEGTGHLERLAQKHHIAIEHGVDNQRQKAKAHHHTEKFGKQPLVKGKLALGDIQNGQPYHQPVKEHTVKA